jgi:transcriptional regulator with XRE-family HTH domain
VAVVAFDNSMTPLRLRDWRERRGLSLRALAERAGVGYVTVWRIEHGELSPTVAMLEKLARALDVHLTDLFPKPSKRRSGRPSRARPAR